MRVCVIAAAVVVICVNLVFFWMWKGDSTLCDVDSLGSHCLLCFAGWK